MWREVSVGGRRGGCLFKPSGRNDGGKAKGLRIRQASYNLHQVPQCLAVLGIQRRRLRPPRQFLWRPGNVPAVCLHAALVDATALLPEVPRVVWVRFGHQRQHGLARGRVTCLSVSFSCCFSFPLSCPVGWGWVGLPLTTPIPHMLVLWLVLSQATGRVVQSSSCSCFYG